MGFGEESSWGSEASRTKFLDILKGGDSLDITEAPVLSEGVNSPGFKASTDFKQGAITAGGQMMFEVPYEGAELLFEPEDF